MAAFIVRRSLGAVATFLLATVVVFALAFALPGDPARAIAGRRQVPESVLVAIRRRYRLDDPLVERYFHWLGGLIRGDFGESYTSHRSVVDLLIEAVPVTATLLLVTLIIEGLLALVLGTLAGKRRGTHYDRVLLVGCTLAMASPVFLVASIGQDLLGVRWKLLPVAGADEGLLSYVLPATTLALTGLAIGIRLLRSETLTQMHAQHVRTARAKGLSEGAITRRHITRNSLHPYIAFIGLEIGALAGGSVIVERIFNLPGVGRVVAQAIGQRDNSMIVGFTMATVLVYLVVDLVVDVVSMQLDPRLRASMRTTT